jgi:hypothetical protein
MSSGEMFRALLCLSPHAVPAPCVCQLMNILATHQYTDPRVLEISRAPPTLASAGTLIDMLKEQYTDEMQQIVRTRGGDEGDVLFLLRFG